MSYSAVRKKLAEALDQVNDDHSPILITRQNGSPAVLMSLEEYRSWEETLHLMRSPRNASRLNSAIRSIEAGKTRLRALLPVKPASGGGSKTRKSSRASTR